MPYHNISATLSAADLTAIKTALNTIKAKLPFLINLTEEERMSMTKMGDKSLAFVTKVNEYVVAYPQYRPPYADYNEFIKDFKLVTELTNLLQIIGPLYDALNHTTMALGSECMEYSGEVYSMVGNASRTNMAGASDIYRDLKERYPRTGGGRPADVPPGE
jgi:hypothetical protein